MRDLLIICPTRGRRGNAERLDAAVWETCTAQTDLIFAADDDDRSYDGLELAASIKHGPRQTFTGWTNEIAATHGHRYRAMASMGDDHLPRTHGWDSIMLAALGRTGIVYGDDLLMSGRLPTAPVISAGIVAALGWMALPACGHLFVDNAWLDLGREAGCLTYLPHVVIEHMHHTKGKAPGDATYRDALAGWPHDEAAYHAWRRSPAGLTADAAKIRALRGEAAA